MTSLSSERAGRTVAAVVLALSALGAVVPFLITDSVASSSPSGAPGGGSGGQGVLGGLDGPGVSDDSRGATDEPGQGGGSGVVQNTPNGEPPPADFPLPSDARRHEDDYIDWVWASRMSAEDLYAFYRDALSAAGWDWDYTAPPDAPTDVGRGVSGPLIHRSDGKRYFFKIETEDFPENRKLVALFLNEEVS